MVSPEANFPSFGDSTWPWAPVEKSQEPQTARLFYAAWINFTTSKEFTWFEQWNLAEAPDRRVRRYAFVLACHTCPKDEHRLMEKDNKKAREDARRDYNDTVRVRNMSFVVLIPINTFVFYSPLLNLSGNETHATKPMWPDKPKSRPLVLHLL